MAPSFIYRGGVILFLVEWAKLAPPLQLPKGLNSRIFSGSRRGQTHDLLWLHEGVKSTPHLLLQELQSQSFPGREQSYSSFSAPKGGEAPTSPLLEAAQATGGVNPTPTFQLHEGAKPMPALPLPEGPCPRSRSRSKTRPRLFYSSRRGPSPRVSSRSWIRSSPRLLSNRFPALVFCFWFFVFVYIGFLSRILYTKAFNLLRPSVQRTTD